jgi:hypothetical protein
VVDGRKIATTADYAVSIDGKIAFTAMVDARPKDQGHKARCSFDRKCVAEDGKQKEQGAQRESVLSVVFVGKAG